MTDEAIAKAMKMTDVPLDGRQLYDSLMSEYRERGYTTLGEICAAYLALDVRPLLRCALKVMGEFHSQDVLIYKSFCTLPVRSCECI